MCNGTGKSKDKGRSKEIEESEKLNVKLRVKVN